MTIHIRWLTLPVVIITSFSSVTAQWVKRSDALRARSEVTSAVYNSKLYTFLGFSNAALETEPSSEVYDPLTNKWTLLSSITAKSSMTHQGVVSIDNTVWHIGGRVGTNPGALTSTIWIYDIAGNSWSPGPQLLDPATGKPLLWAAGGAVLLGRTLHVFGGFVNTACNGDQDKYHLTLDVDTWLANRAKQAAWVNNRSPLPMKRNHFGTVVMGGKIYAIGGQFGHDCGGGLDQRVVHVYDPAYDTWTALPLLPLPRSHIEGGTFAIDGKIYITAGQGTDGVSTNKVTIFNPLANNGAGEWKDDVSLTLPKSYEGVSAKVIDNTFIYSHGGEGSSAGTRKETYTRTITRSPVYKLGFTSSCLNLNALSGSAIKGKNLLFTIDGAAAYTLSSSASWLTITKNTSGSVSPNGVDIEITANSAALSPGNYSASVIAKSSANGPEYTQASFCVNLKVATRINAGGAATTVNDIQWAGCTATGLCNNYVKGGFAYKEKSLPAITGYSSELSQAIFQTEWTGGQNGANPVPIGSVAFSYNIPVNNGRYLVRLHFAELNKKGAGLRKFDVNIGGGEKELVNFDIYAAAGGTYKAIYRDFPVSVTNGMISIDFIRQVENAKISAIEILPVSTTLTTLEAESATVYGASLATNHAGYTGSGFVDFINSSNDYIQWNVSQSAAGTVELLFRYSNGSGVNRPLKLEVNGIEVTTGLLFPSTDAWTNWSMLPLTVNLLSGNNTIRLTSIGYNGPNLDHLQLNSYTTMPAAIASGALTVEDHSQAKISADQPKQSILRVVPNPVSGYAKITFGSFANINGILEVRDMVGRLYTTLKIAAGTSAVNLPVKNLPAGTYNITLIQGTHKTNARLVVIN